MFLRTVLVAAVIFFAALPLRDILAYPDRVSVLPNLQTDAATYYQLATDVAEAHSFRPLPPRHPPGWPGVLAALFTFVGPSYVAGKMLLWLSLLASIVACAWLARRIYTPAAGWVAALLCASSPALRGYVGTLQYEVFTGTLVLLVLVLAVRAIDSPAARTLYRRAVWVGVAGGGLILTRETFLVVLPLVAAWIAHRVGGRVPPRTAMAAAVLTTCVAVTPAIMWSAVQSVRHGTLITISEKGPMVVELGHNPLANGTYNAPLVGTGQPSGVRFVLQRPGRAMVLSIRKALYFWGVLRDGWNVPRPAAVWMWRATTGLVPVELFAALARGGWLLVLFVIALWWLGRQGLSAWWALPATVLLLMLVHVATLSSHRFAVPVLPLVFVLGSGPLAAALRRLRAPLGSPAVVAAMVVLVGVMTAMQFQRWPLHRTLRAADLDGLGAANQIDHVIERRVRFADAARGVRPVVLLADEYLPRGVVRLNVVGRRASELVTASAPMMRVTLVDLDGRTLCDRIVGTEELATERFGSVTLTCHVPRDTVATLAIFSLGTVDFAIADLVLDWGR